MDEREPELVRLALERFSELFAADAFAPAGPKTVKLDEAALAISAVLQPGLDVARWMAALDEVAEACPIPTRGGITNHLFESGRLVGDAASYGDWRNSCIDHVIATRKGIPITLSVVAIEVARRLGVPLVGIGMPAHFLIGDPLDSEWFFDPFNGRRLLGIEECQALFAQITGDAAGWRDSYLRATPNRAIVTRMLNNLRAGFARRDDRVRLALAMRMRMAIAEIAGEDDEAARAQAVLN